MFDKLRQVIIALNARGNEHSIGQSLRRLVLMILRSKNLKKDFAGVMRIAARFEQETASWLRPEAVSLGESGHFDACDLRHWLALCERAGVAAVPAKIVLKLSDEEMSALSGSIGLPAGYAGKLATKLSTLELTGSEDDQCGEDADAIDMDAVVEKLFDAMDLVPEGSMVRHVRCGPSTLKALAGAGAAGPELPETRFGPELEVGPGWVRAGNRRRIDASDARFVEGAAQGPADNCYFVARPWVQASRWATGEDPHRHGTRFAGKGTWPSEWRAFVEGGKVIGVSTYYAWCGSATPENAQVALQVRDLAQRIVDAAEAQKAFPAYMDIEFLRENPAFADICDRFPRDAVAATLDFIETDKGILFLEGGPAYTPVGGGHPCGFAGLQRAEGVAFRIMDGVSLADPKSWSETSRQDAILSWGEVEALAFAPISSNAAS